MTLTKYHLKILQFIYSYKKTITVKQLRKHFKKDPDLDSALLLLTRNDYIGSLSKKHVGSGPILPLADEFLFDLTDKGIAEVESHQWFDAQYVFTSIVIPIIVGIASSAITALLLALLA